MMDTFPKSEKTRRELLSFLGIQGGTCHLMPELIRTYNNGAGISLTTKNHYIYIVPHKFMGNRIEIFPMYRFSNNGVYSDSPVTKEQTGFGACNPQSPKIYIDWKNPIMISFELKHWFTEYAIRNS